MLCVSLLAEMSPSEDIKDTKSSMCQGSVVGWFCSILRPTEPGYRHDAHISSTDLNTSILLIFPGDSKTFSPCQAKRLPGWLGSSIESRSLFSLSVTCEFTHWILCNLTHRGSPLLSLQATEESKILLTDTASTSNTRAQQQDDVMLNQSTLPNTEGNTTHAWSIKTGYRNRWRQGSWWATTSPDWFENSQTWLWWAGDIIICLIILFLCWRNRNDSWWFWTRLWHVIWKCGPGEIFQNSHFDVPVPISDYDWMNDATAATAECETKYSLKPQVC